MRIKVLPEGAPKPLYPYFRIIIRFLWRIPAQSAVSPSSHPHKYSLWRDPNQVVENYADGINFAGAERIPFNGKGIMTAICMGMGRSEVDQIPPNNSNGRTSFTAIWDGISCCPAVSYLFNIIMVRHE